MSSDRCRITVIPVRKTCVLCSQPARSTCDGGGATAKCLQRRAHLTAQPAHDGSAAYLFACYQWPLSGSLGQDPLWATYNTRPRLCASPAQRQGVCLHRGGWSPRCSAEARLRLGCRSPHMSISRSSSYQRLPSLQLADAADEELGIQACIGSPAKGHAPQLYTAPSLARPPLPPVSCLTPGPSVVLVWLPRSSRACQCIMRVIQPPAGCIVRCHTLQHARPIQRSGSRAVPLRRRVCLCRAMQHCNTTTYADVNVPLPAGLAASCSTLTHRMYVPTSGCCLDASPLILLSSRHSDVYLNCGCGQCTHVLAQAGHHQYAHHHGVVMLTARTVPLCAGGGRAKLPAQQPAHGAAAQVASVAQLAGMAVPAHHQRAVQAACRHGCGPRRVPCCLVRLLLLLQDTR